MDRNLTSLLTLGATAAISVTLAAVAPDSAYADPFTVDADLFFRGSQPADVQPEPAARPAAVRNTGGGEWALQQDPSPMAGSTLNRQQAQAEYKASRSYVRALTGEDSGAGLVFKSTGAAANPAATLGGPAR